MGRKILIVGALDDATHARLIAEYGASTVRVDEHTGLLVSGEALEDLMSSGEIVEEGSLAAVIAGTTSVARPATIVRAPEPQDHPDVMRGLAYKDFRDCGHSRSPRSAPRKGSRHGR